MTEIILTCCGVTIPGPPEDIDCPKCGTHFTEDQVEQLQLQELTKIPVVDPRLAARMLAPTPEWVMERRDALEPIYGAAVGIDIAFPIDAILRFATEQNLRVNPLPAENGVLWINRSTA